MNTAIHLSAKNSRCDSVGFKRGGTENESIEVNFSEYYSQKRRRKTVQPPPLPLNKKIFPIYTPPSTPHRPIRVNMALGLPSPNHSCTKAEVLDSKQTHSLGSASKLDQENYKAPSFFDGLFRFQSTDIELPMVSNVPLSHGLPQPDNGLIFLDHKDAEVDTEPDYSKVKQTCDRYFPHIIKLHAPSCNKTAQCSETGCCAELSGHSYRCRTCFSSKWYCRDCIVSTHHDNPLHRIEKWSDEEMMCTSVSLEQIGLVVKFNNLDGTDCLCSGSHENTRMLEVIHVDGIHKIRYLLCHCNSHQKVPQSASPEQLLTNRLYPATNVHPRRAFSFDLLTEYDILNLYGFINIKQYLDAKVFLTPNDLTIPEQVSNHHSK
jgi:hypothetical protein